MFAEYNGTVSSSLRNLWRFVYSLSRISLFLRVSPTTPAWIVSFISNFNYSKLFKKFIAIYPHAYAWGLLARTWIKSYLFLVSLLVELLALGSIQLVGARAIRYTYYIFTILSTIVALYFVAVSYIGYIITGYIVYGPLPLSVTLISSIITFPAAVVLVVVAAVSYWRTHSKKMLSIIAGTVVVSIAGTLYIVQFPAFLYYAEFIGILLLWLGFFSRKKIAS